MVEVFNTHTFLFTLNYEKKIKGHEVIFVDRDDKEHKIKLSKIEITSSQVSCKLYDEKDNKHIVALIRIKKILKDGVVVWDNSDADSSNVRVIKGYE